MAKFFVGQRVRILWSRAWPELAGEEGRIISSDVQRAQSEECEWVVAPDCWGSHRAPYAGIGGGVMFAPNSYQLEPILPEGQQPCEEEFKQDMDNLLSKQLENA